MAKYRIECKDPSDTDWYVHLDNLTFAMAKRHLIVAIESDAEPLADDSAYDELCTEADFVEGWNSFDEAFPVGALGYEYRIVKDDGEHRTPEAELVFEND